MDRIEAFRRSFAHGDWANQALCEALRSCSDPPREAVAWLAHVVGAESLWLARLNGGASALAVWPELALPELANALSGLRLAWQALLEPLTAPALERTIHYTNTRGERWTNRVDDVLEHVLLHGAHHRGQIASALRAAGQDPPVLDYIHYVRTGQVR
jgi:uncharacterized damage-inducible protein DinB